MEGVAVTQPSAEPDLAALMSRVLPRLAELEAPILAAAGLSMWEYAILSELAGGGAVSQSELSSRVRRDPTRLGRHLDDLASRDLVVRESAEDKRQRTVHLTDAGRASHGQAKREIREVEDELLAGVLTRSQAATLRDCLRRLAEGG